MEILKFCMNFYDFWYGFYMEKQGTYGFIWTSRDFYEFQT